MNTEKAKKIIEDVLKLAGVPAESVVYNLDEKRGHVFVVESSELRRLSETREDIVRDTVYLLKKMFDQASPGGESFKCTIDINGEQTKKDSAIKMKALNAAESARSLKADVLMDPMSSYERMVVHSTLAGQPGISTESVGEGRDRKIKVLFKA